MDEQEFDALFSSRPFGTQNAMREDARLGLCGTLGTLLFGRTPDDLRCQLLASQPEIPPGYDLADFQDLQRHLEMVIGALSDPRNTWLSPLRTAAFGVIEIGTQRLSVWEARLEILRRAIVYLENREELSSLVSGLFSCAESGVLATCAEPSQCFPSVSPKLKKEIANLAATGKALCQVRNSLLTSFC